MSNNVTIQTALDLTFGVANTFAHTTTLTEDISPAFDAIGKYEIWVKYTAQPGDSGLAVNARARDNAFVHPLTDVWLWDGISAPPDPDVDLPYVGLTTFSPGQTLWVPVTPGTTYYVRVYDTGVDLPTGSFVYVQVAAPPRVVAPAGTILIPDDNAAASDDPYPATLLDDTGGGVLQARRLVNGEEADVLDSGIFGVMNDDANSDPLALTIYGPDLSTIATVPITWGDDGGGGLAFGGKLSLRGDGTGNFYVARFDSVANNTPVKVVSDAGVVGGTTYVLPVDGLANPSVTIAPDRANAVLYHTNGVVGQSDIRRWNLNTNTAMADLAPAIAGYRIGMDMMVLPDGSLFVPYEKTASAATYDAFVRIYNTSTGATIRDITIPFLQPATTILIQLGPRYALGTDPDTFWAWNSGYDPDGFLDGSGAHYVNASKFTELSLSDGHVITTFTVPVQDAGLGVPTTADDPDVPLFANSTSCPFLILRHTVEPPPTVHTTSEPPPPAPPRIPGCCDPTGTPPPNTPAKTPKPTAGCNPGGAGNTPTYTFASGTVPIGADPEPGETFTGKRTMFVWLEISHPTFDEGSL